MRRLTKQRCRPPALHFHLLLPVSMASSQTTRQRIGYKSASYAWLALARTASGGGWTHGNLEGKRAMLRRDKEEDRDEESPLTFSRGLTNVSSTILYIICSMPTLPYEDLSTEAGARKTLGQKTHDQSFTVCLDSLSTPANWKLLFVTRVCCRARLTARSAGYRPSGSHAYIIQGAWYKVPLV
jgi:hypothetical protein